MSAVDEETKRAAIEIFQREGIAAAQAHAGVVPSTIYSWLKKAGVRVRNAPPEVRIWLYVELPVDPWACWLWSGVLDGKGYGSFWDGTRQIKAHRWMFEHFGGTYPEGRPHLDHLCRVRSCCNPIHLDPVSNRENTRRGLAGHARAAQLRAITHCPAGHLYDEANTYIAPNSTSRHCRTCKSQRNAERQKRLREERAA